MGPHEHGTSARRCRDNIRSALLGDFSQKLVNLLFEIHVQNAVGLVHHQILDRLEMEASGVLKMVHNAPGCRCGER